MAEKFPPAFAGWRLRHDVRVERRCFERLSAAADGGQLVKIQKDTVKATLTGGLTAGAVDFAYATTFYYVWRQMTAMELWQYVASGAIGRVAFDGGYWTAALGIALHFMIACFMAAAFVIISRRAQILLRHAILSGLLYGVCLYYFMNGVVLPLSNVPASPDLSNFPMVGNSALNFVGGLFIHAFGVGLPIAVFARRNLLKRQWFIERRL